MRCAEEPPAHPDPRVHGCGERWCWSHDIETTDRIGTTILEFFITSLDRICIASWSLAIWSTQGSDGDAHEYGLTDTEARTANLSEVVHAVVANPCIENISQEAPDRIVRQGYGTCRDWGRERRTYPDNGPTDSSLVERRDAVDDCDDVYLRHEGHR